MSEMLREVKAVHKPSGKEEVAQVMSEVLAQVLKRARQALDGDAPAARHEINQALALLARPPAPTEVRPGHRRRARRGLAPWQMRRVIHHIHTNIEAPIRARDMAGLTRLSTSYFFRAFNCSFGVSPHAYVLALRLARARELLVNSDDQMIAIAAACGFADQAHFSRMFRREVGCAPSVWRREQLGAVAPATRSTPASTDHRDHGSAPPDMMVARLHTPAG